MKTLTVQFADGSRRTYSSWVELYSVFDKTPWNKVQGAYIWVRHDNVPEVEKFQVHMSEVVSNGYPLIKF